MPTKKRPDIQSERQAQILDAARQVFAEKGLSDARMEDIASACGLGKGTVYLYYKNKDDLILGLLQALFSQFLQHLDELVSQDHLTVTDRLTGYIQQMVAQMETDRSILNIAYEFYAIASRHQAIRDYLAGYFVDYRRALETLFTQGIERGEFIAFDSSQTAITFIAILEGFTLLWFTDSQAVAFNQIIPNTVAEFLKNLKA
ncbi:MAG: TetR/AcrR family transcriptional regulator [Anaerolineae bacterium]|nr:TetR/AcrR family transcriptional regulator [Anaerolineae bacterium]